MSRNVYLQFICVYIICICFYHLIYAWLRDADKMSILRETEEELIYECCWLENTKWDIGNRKG